MSKKESEIQEAQIVEGKFDTVAEQPAKDNGATFLVHEIYTLHRELIPSGILDKAGDRYHNYTGKERYAVARFVRWVNSEYELAEKIREQILQASKEDNNDGSKKSPTAQWNEAIMETVTYPHSKLIANEDFFERVHISNEAIGKLKGFIVIE